MIVLQVTQVTVRLRRIPTHTVAALCYFPSVEHAANSVMEMIQRDMTIGMVEFLDEMMMAASRLHFNFKYEEKPTLYFEFSAASRVQLDVRISLTYCYFGIFNSSECIGARKSRSGDLFEIRWQRLCFLQIRRGARASLPSAQGRSVCL